MKHSLVHLCWNWRTHSHPVVWMMNEGLYFKADSSLRIIGVWEVKQENRRLKIATRNIQTVTFTALLIFNRSGHGYIKNCRSFFYNSGDDWIVAQRFWDPYFSLWSTDQVDKEWCRFAIRPLTQILVSGRWLNHDFMTKACHTHDIASGHSGYRLTMWQYSIGVFGRILWFSKLLT